MNDFIVTVRRPRALLSRTIAVRAADGAEASAVAVARMRLQRGRSYEAVGITRARITTPRDYGF